MRILGLDLGNTAGWALYDNGKVTSGILQNWLPSQSRFEGGGMRYLRFEDALRGFGHIDRIAFEEVRSHKRAGQFSENVTAAQVYGGYLAILTAWCERNNVPVGSYSVGTIKKRATGKGNSNKEGVLQAAKKLLPKCQIDDENQADALWCLVLEVEAAGLVLLSS